MFSHDGSTAPLHEYLDVMPKDAMLLVDDAHGAGTLGQAGRGTPEVCGVRDPRVVQTISLSKAFGVYGGAVLGTAEVIEAIQNRSRIFNGNTPPPLPLVNATLASLMILKSDLSFAHEAEGQHRAHQKRVARGGFADHGQLLSHCSARPTRLSFTPRVSAAPCCASEFSHR